MKLTVHPTNGRIYARLKTGDPARPYVRMTLGTKSAEEARAKAKEANLGKIEAALQAGQLSTQAIARLTVGHKLTTEQAFTEWCDRGARRNDAPSTTAKNRAVGEQWFRCVPAIRSLPPMSLTEDHVSAFVNREDAAVGAATRRRQLSVVRMFLRSCVDTGLSRGIDTRRILNHRALSHAQLEPKQVQPFTAEEVQTILANTEGWWRWAVGIANAAGLRLGDVCTLEHAALSLPGHIIIHTHKRNRRVCLPVNEEITPGLAAILAEVPPSESSYLFPEEAEQYADVAAGRSKFSMQFNRLLASLEIHGRSFHSLRHTAISRWAAQGFSLDQCRDYAGHSSEKTTTGYIHP